MTADGRYVVWATTATNVVSGFTDSNGGGGDVYWRDMITGQKLLVSGANNSQTLGGDGASGFPIISAGTAGTPGGRGTVLFWGYASNTATFSVTDPANTPNIFLRAPGGNGMLIDQSTNTSGIYAGNGPAGYYAITPDSKYVVFESRANDLVPGFTDSNGAAGGDVYRRDLTVNAPAPNGIRLVSGSSATSGGNDTSYDARPPVISDDGNVVAWSSRATNLVPGFTDGNGVGFDVFARTLDAAITGLVSRAAGSAVQGANGPSGDARLSGDGRYVAFGSAASNLGVADANGVRDLFRFDRLNGATALVSAAPSGGAAGSESIPALSGNGRYAAFASGGGGGFTDRNGAETDVFRRDVEGGTTALASAVPFEPDRGGAGASGEPWISGDGSTVTFTSAAPDLVAPFTDRNGAGRDAYARVFGIPRATAAPAALGFGGAVAGTRTAARTVTLTNPGDARLAVGSVTIDGADAGQFGLGVERCSQRVLAPGGTCTVEAVFAPTAPGARSATLTVRTEADAGPTTVALTGTGTPAPAAPIVLAPPGLGPGATLRPVAPSNAFRIRGQRRLRDGQIELTIEVPGRGAVRALATARVRSPTRRRPRRTRLVTVASATASVPAARTATVRLRLRPTPAATSLIRRRALAATVAVTYTPTGGTSARRTLAVRFRRPAARRRNG